MKTILFFTTSVTLFAVATTILILFNYNPYSSPASVFIMFYLALFFSLAGALSLLSLFIKFRMGKNINRQLFGRSARQGIFISLAIVALLALQGMKVLDLWVGVPIVISILLLELFILQRKVKKN